MTVSSKVDKDRNRYISLAISLGPVALFFAEMCSAFLYCMLWKKNCVARFGIINWPGLVTGRLHVRSIFPVANAFLHGVLSTTSVPWMLVSEHTSYRNTTQRRPPHRSCAFWTVAPLKSRRGWPPPPHSPPPSNRHVLVDLTMSGSPSTNDDEAHENSTRSSRRPYCHSCS